MVILIRFDHHALHATWNPADIFWLVYSKILFCSRKINDAEKCCMLFGCHSCLCFLSALKVKYSMNNSHLVYTTQVDSTFCARWLASLEVISQVLFTSEEQKKNKMAFAGILSQIKLLFGPLVIQLVWYILKQLSTSVSVKVVYIYQAASWLGKYPPLFTSTSVNNC